MREVIGCCKVDHIGHEAKDFIHKEKDREHRPRRLRKTLLSILPPHTAAAVPLCHPSLVAAAPTHGSESRVLGMRGHI